jgi:integrase
MSRTVQEANIMSPTSRARLAVRPEPYYRSLQRGLALGYRRGQRGGTWLVRGRDPQRGGYIETKIGPADDGGGKNVDGLSFDEAAQRAREIFGEDEARRVSGVRPSAKKALISDVLDRYVEGYKSGDARRDGRPGRDLANLQSILDRHIRPALGSMRLDQLNSDVLEKFKTDLVAAPKLTRNGRPAAKVDTDGFEDAEAEAERLRKRRARANRVVTPLRAALNYAVKGRLIATDTAWRSALKPFSGVDGATVRYLDLDECRALQQHADQDFRPLVAGALFTGARYGSLRHLRVKDIDFRARTVMFRVTKSGQKQSVRVTKAACEFLKSQIADRGRDDYVFLKSSGEQWQKSDQQRRMDKACAGAGIEPTATFHELRDTFASHLVLKGVPILTVSRLLGHADVRITERHYAHLRPDHLQQAVDEHLPDFTAE